VDSKFGSLWGEWCFFEPTRVIGVGLWKDSKKKGGINFPVLPVLKWWRGPRLAFCMTSDVGK